LLRHQGFARKRYGRRLAFTRNGNLRIPLLKRLPGRIQNLEAQRSGLAAQEREVVKAHAGELRILRHCEREVDGKAVWFELEALERELQLALLALCVVQ
jgi:hypothetical protein